MSPSPVDSIIAVAASHDEISGLVFAFCLSAAPSRNVIGRFRRDQYRGRDEMNRRGYRDSRSSETVGVRAGSGSDISHYQERLL
jgi:hypothetical protein